MSGLSAVVGDLEPHLVVALARRAMRDRIGADQLGDLDLPLRDQGAGDAGAQQVLAFVQRVGAEHRKHEVADERLAQVVHEDFLDAEHLRLPAGRFQLLALAQVGGEGHDLAPVVCLQPAQDHAGVQPAGVGEHDFLHVLDGHGHPSLIVQGYRIPACAGKGRPETRATSTLLS